MANERGKSIDNTHLPAKNYIQRQILHRDILAHHLRWTHVAKYARKLNRYKTAKVLDIGCGIDVPLARMFYTNRTAVKHYVGVDYNNPSKFDVINFGKMPVDIYGGINFPDDVYFGSDTDWKYAINTGPNNLEYFHSPNIIVCFEMIEHIEPGHAREVLSTIGRLLRRTQNAGEEAVAFISTPCYDAHVGAAANHVSEITRDALGATIEDLGFRIDGCWGTFASMKDYKDKFFADYGDAACSIWKRLNDYYDSNYIATIFAPMYPEFSRNNLWEIIPLKDGEKYERKFPPLAEVEGPWTSSSHWNDLRGE